MAKGSTKRTSVSAAAASAAEEPAAEPAQTEPVTGIAAEALLGDPEPEPERLGSFRSINGLHSMSSFLNGASIETEREIFFDPKLVSFVTVANRRVTLGMNGREFVSVVVDKMENAEATALAIIRAR